jgi:(p)ppGpp synthase/HD superfamily hydrolase
MKPELLEKALELALMAHRGQRDKSGAAYIWHPIRVSMACTNDDARLVGLLHDVLEDSDLESHDLERAGIPRAVIDAVEALTRRPFEDYYGDYLARVLSNRIAMEVKLADLEDNLDVTRLAEISERDKDRINRYLRVRRLVLDALGKTVDHG